MSPLRQRMIQDMQLRGFSARTQECCVAAVGQLAEHYQTSPDQLSEEHLRQYFLYLLVPSPAKALAISREPLVRTVVSVALRLARLVGCGALLGDIRLPGTCR